MAVGMMLIVKLMSSRFKDVHSRSLGPIALDEPLDFAAIVRGAGASRLLEVIISRVATAEA